nr:hypothetical protein Iba_chr11aCG18310 [Ipomoea batatas]
MKSSSAMFLASNAIFPHAISNTNAPNAYTSLLFVALLLLASSGARYSSAAAIPLITANLWAQFRVLFGLWYKNASRLPFGISGPVAAEKPTNISPLSKTDETLSYGKVRRGVRGEDWVPAEESQVPKRTVLVAIPGDPRRRRHHSVHVDSDVVVAQVVKLPGLDHVELDGEDMVGGVPVGGLIHQSHKLPGGAAGEIVGRRNDESHSMAAFRGE